MTQRKITLYKNGDSFGIRTACRDEDDFIDEFSYALEEIIEQRRFDDDWQFQLSGWIRKAVDVCEYYKGHDTKSKVSRIVTSGETEPVGIIVKR